MIFFSVTNRRIHKGGVVMDSQRNDPNERKAIEQLKTDKHVWEWCMPQNQFDEILSKYKRIKPAHSLSYLAMQVMGYGKDSPNAALSHFRQIRQRRARTNGWAVFNLTQEINHQCRLSHRPVDFAKPTGKNCQSSLVAMEYLWSCGELDEKLKAVMPQVHQLFQDNGINIQKEMLVDGIMEALRKQYTKLF